MAAVVRQVDHVVVRTDDAASLFQLFTETLVLPVGWPLESYGAFQSGGVGFGNVIMELMRVGEGKGVGARSAFFAGIALEPVPLAEALAELDARGVAYGETQPPHGRQPWTEAMLTDLSRGCYVFLCEYTFGVDKRRQRIRRELDSRDGGPLGILRLDHIEVGVAHHDNASRNWQSVLAPALEPAPATWVLGDGPAIKLSPAERDGILSLTFAVASLARARAFLQKEGMLGESTATAVTIAPSAVQGLGLRIEEASATLR